MTGLPYVPYVAPEPACTCPAYWWGVVPAHCPVHNPYSTSWLPTSFKWPDSLLTPQDIEKIAQRVAEILKAPAPTTGGATIGDVDVPSLPKKPEPGTWQCECAECKKRC